MLKQRKFISGKLVEIENLFGKTIEEKIFNMLDEHDTNFYRDQIINMDSVSNIEDKYNCFIMMKYNKIYRIHFAKNGNEDILKNYVFLNDDNTIYFCIQYSHDEYLSLNDDLETLIKESEILDQ